MLKIKLLNDPWLFLFPFSSNQRIWGHTKDVHMRELCPASGLQFCPPLFQQWMSRLSQSPRKWLSLSSPQVCLGPPLGWAASETWGPALSWYQLSKSLPVADKIRRLNLGSPLSFFQQWYQSLWFSLHNHFYDRKYFSLWILWKSPLLYCSCSQQGEHVSQRGLNVKLK